MCHPYKHSVNKYTFTKSPFPVDSTSTDIYSPHSLRIKSSFFSSVRYCPRVLGCAFTDGRRTSATAGMHIFSTIQILPPTKQVC